MKVSSKHVGWLALAAFCIVAVAIDAAADDRESPIPSWGKELFEQHCAPCHGREGRGGGPAAATLKTAPTDLTLISKAHQGKFPYLEVVHFIDGEHEVTSHGSREMPVWGRVFRNDAGDFAARAEVYALAQYIESIQQK